MPEPKSYASFEALGLRAGGERITAISPPEIAWLLAAAAGLPVRRSLEVGFGLGYSAAALLHAGVEQHVTIECEPGRLPLARENAARAARPGQVLRVLEGPSDLVLPQLVIAGERFDLMLIDGGHRFDDVLVDSHFARFLVRPGGLMVLDDAKMAATRAVTSWIETNLSHVWKRGVVPPRFGRRYDFQFAVYRRTDDDDDATPTGSRPWNRHRRFETFEDEN
ncbi:MAG: class I SAM-dependent methyltransferase [Alphaproteobacteria bacterium]